MSLVARIILALMSALFGVMMIFIAPPTDKAIFFYAFGAFCISIATVCFTRGHLAQFFGSIIGLAVSCTGLFYLGHELMEGKIFSGSRSQPSVFNACMFMLVFGIPGGAYVLNARFGLRRHTTQLRQ